MNINTVRFLILLGVAAIACLFVWKFWITLLVLLALVNATLGIAGAAIIFPRFFKRKMDLENILVWAACLIGGCLVFIFAWNYKPRYPIS